eukprot:CAMPEP_0181381102 /NCGR_PEP_ID=MMETSP1106-20121128/19930_1 /TAXON_ID=81844 /ORGANISM="Mantoniella antarctica, Strain SL-175" /LENGTH=92 /DNA_ID=CAMNT_0023500239 /DNA_START=333 /DNA_END=612 /DNA_ORIENTATION=+
MAGKEDLSPIHCAGSMGMEEIDASPTAAPLDALLSPPRRRRIPEAAVITAQHSTSRCPPLATAAHVDAFQGQSLSRAQHSRVTGGADKVANA